MSSKAKQHVIADKILCCPVCECNLFHTKTVQLNNMIANFLGLDNKESNFKGYICDKCSYIFPFMK
mgnify:CR=1